MKIQKMTYKDFEEIKSNIQVEFDDFWTESILKKELENENTRYIVAKENNKVVGFAGLLISPDIAEIMNIVTKKSERKKGIGSLLLDKLIEIAIDEDKEEITLEVNEKNTEAINLYSKKEFKIVGNRKKYYDSKYDAIIMTKKLKNV